MTNSQPAANDRAAFFMNDCPRAGSEFPEMTVNLLDGGELQFASLQGKAVVLQAGSFT